MVFPVHAARSFDYDATETAVLIDTRYQGAPRKLLVEANRNGFVYVLDRTNGRFLTATPFVQKLNWAKAIDERPPHTERRKAFGERHGRMPRYDRSY